MRILAMLFLLTFFAVQGCTSDFPTAEDPGDAIVSETGQLAKSDNAAGVIRYEENVFHWAYDAGRNIEIVFFDPFLLCEAGLPAAFERANYMKVLQSWSPDPTGAAPVL